MEKRKDVGRRKRSKRMMSKPRPESGAVLQPPFWDELLDSQGGAGGTALFIFLFCVFQIFILTEFWIMKNK